MAIAARLGRPPVLTREAIALAVIDVGFTDLTVAAVRAQLDVGQTTLYRYAANRDELVRIGLDHLFKHAAWPSRDGAWREVISQHAFVLWRLLAAHPGSASEIIRGVYSLTGMRVADDMCAILLRQGFTPANAILVCDIVFDMVIDNRHAIENHNFAATHIATTQSCEHYPNQAESKVAHPATADEREAIHAEIEKAFAADLFKWFVGKLNVALDGIEHSLAPRPDGAADG